MSCRWHSQSEAETRLRKYFQLSPNVMLESKPSPILKQISFGTPENEIYQFLDRNGVGKDGLSSYYRAGERGEIVCRVEYDVKSPGFVKESFGVFLSLDQERKLTDVRIQRWLTGAVQCEFNANSRVTDDRVNKDSHGFYCLESTDRGELIGRSENKPHRFRF